MIATGPLALLFSLIGQVPAEPARPADPSSTRRPAPAPPSDSFRPDPSWKRLGNEVFFDPTARRVILRTRVCLVDGPLEHLLCLKGTKEHEAILQTEAPPKLIQAALILTGAEPGHPVRFEPKFEPPAGTPIAIRAEWERDGKTQAADVREWVRDDRTKAPLDRPWVFAGSVLYSDPRTKQMAFAADEGDLITVANFASAILDLPYRSSSSDAERAYVANPERIPPVGTPVTLYLAPDPVKPASGPARGGP